MHYYYLGLTVESPEREQAIVLRDAFLDTLKLATRGRMFVEPYTDLLDNQKFLKLIDYMNPTDVLLMHDLTRSSRNIYNLLELLNALSTRNINVVNMSFPRVNTIDFPFLYEELSELLLLLQNFSVFLYCIGTRTLDNFDFSQVTPLHDIDRAFWSFTRHTVRSEIRSYGVCETVTEFMEHVTSEEATLYAQQYLGLNEPYIFDEGYDSLYFFNEYIYSRLN